MAQSDRKAVMEKIASQCKPKQQTFQSGTQINEQDLEGMKLPPDLLNNLKNLLLQYGPALVAMLLQMFLKTPVPVPVTGSGDADTSDHTTCACHEALHHSLAAAQAAACACCCCEHQKNCDNDDGK